MQTLRKKNSPCKFKNEPTRFLGEGVSFKAKLIGILEVAEARGDRMCQMALADLKMAIRAAGEHKQRIAVEVSIDGLRLRDEKSGVCLFHHPVHKISFICQDMSDTRAFGYIFGSPDTGHRFFGIKTDKAASQVVIAVRELFQVVLELKKKEIELAKQQIEQNAINAIKFHTSGIFVEPAPDTKGAAGTESSLHRMRTTNSEVEKPAERKDESQSGVIADLLDLQFELNSLQQGIHQMDKITPENPAPSSEELFESDPFGDSFANMKLKETVQPILPPPPSSSKRSHLERQQTVPGPQTSASSSPATIASKTPPPQSSMHWFDKEAENLFNDNEAGSLTTSTPSKRDSDEAQAKSPQVDVFTELDPLGTGLIKPYVDKKDFFQHLKNPPKKVLKDLVSTNASDTFPTDFHSSGEQLDTIPGESGSRDSDHFEDSDFANFDRFDEKDTLQQTLTRSESPRRRDSKSSLLRQLLSGSVPPEEPATPKTSVTQGPSTSPADVPTYTRTDKEPGEPKRTLIKLSESPLLPSPKKYLQSARKKEFDFEMAGNRGQSMDKSFPVDFTATTESPASPLRSCSSDANSRLSTSSAELELVPEPPPRGAGSILINPPPLPPKKQNVRGAMKPPPRPPHTDTHFHYDFPERARASPSPTRSRERPKTPLKDTKSQFDDNFSPPIGQATGTSDIIGSITTSAFEDSFSSMIPTTNLTSYFTSTSSSSNSSKAKPSLDITLSQLTSSNLNELANSLGMTVQELTSLTLQQLTECLASLSMKESVSNDSEVHEVRLSKQESVPTTKAQTQSLAMSNTIEQSHFVSSEPLFKPNFDQESKQESTYDKYAVFRELLELEQLEQPEQSAEVGNEEKNDEELSEEGSESKKGKHQPEFQDISVAESLASSVNVIVRLPPTNESQPKEEFVSNITETNDIPADLKSELDQSTVVDENDPEYISYLQMIVDGLTKQTADVKVEEGIEKEQPVELVDERIVEGRTEIPSKDSDASASPEKDSTESNIPEASSPAAPEKPEEKPTQSTSTDRYAALREIIGEPEPIIKTEDEPPSPSRVSPVVQQQPKQSRSLAEAELLNLFSDPLPSPSSPKKQLKKEDDLKAMDIFEEIKMLNTGIQQRLPDKESKSLVPGFEDVFCPFSESKSEKEEMKDDGNWAKFDTGVFGSDRSSGEGPRSVGGTSPWSPDGKEFHRESSFKGSMHRHSGDSDNEWKDEEESEESNGRMMGEARSWCRHPRFNPPAFEDRSFYEESPGTPGEKRERDRSFRDRMGRKTRGAPWHRPPPWHEEGQWEEDPWHNPHCKMGYKDVEDPCLRPYWKCRPKSQLWKRGPEHPATYDEERKRRLMLWSEEDRFGSQESMCYEDEETWPRRKYDRRRWEEDPRYGRRMAPPHEGDYPMRESYYYYRESRERPHGYPPAWDQEYGPERPADDSPRYNPSARKRHWPKRPNSANDGRNAEMVYSESRSKFGSRSECSDNDSDPYLRPSQRSRSRESYWGSDQEYDSWVERPYWSEGPDTKSESLHRKRIPRHKGARQPPAKTQSPFEDDFSQSGEQAESPAVETPGPEPRVRPDTSEGKREPPPASPSTSARLAPKEHFVGFEYDLTPTASASSDTSDRPRPASDLKATPEELPCDPKEPNQAIDSFVPEDSGRDSFFNGDLRYDDDAFAFKSELEDNVPDHRTLPLKNMRQSKYGSGPNNAGKTRGDQYIRKSESVNIFVRESDPFDDDDFFN